MKYPLIIFACALLCFTPGPAHSQTTLETINQLFVEDSVDVSTLAAYPENVRNSAFEAGTRPQGIMNLNDERLKSNALFKKVLDPYSRPEQEKVWNLVRYNGLVHQLVITGRQSKEALEDVLKAYPATVHDDAMNYALNQMGLLQTIDKINEQFNAAFQNIVASYPPSVQTAFNELLKTPDVISLLNNNMHMTVRLGDIYMKDPDLLKQQFAELNLELAQQKAKDAEEWKQEMNNDPDARQELEQSAKEYATEQGYTGDDYYNTDPIVVKEYVYVPYPYWSGYPWWYDNEYWYPYPYWYNWGFYYWHHDIFWLGPPSWYFVHWHFHHHPHCYHYPHVTNTYIHYYYGRHRAAPGGGVVVRGWYKENRETLPANFITDDKQRVNSIKEFGKLSVDYEQYNKANPTENIKQVDYLNTHAKDYPDLRPATDKQTPPKSVTPVENQPVERNNNPVEKNPVQKVPDNRFPEKQTPGLQNNNQTQPPKYQPPIKTPTPNYQPKPQVKPNVTPRQQPPAPKPNVQPPRQVQPLPRQSKPAPMPKQQPAPKAVPKGNLKGK